MILVFVHVYSVRDHMSIAHVHRKTVREHWAHKDGYQYTDTGYQLTSPRTCDKQTIRRSIKADVGQSIIGEPESVMSVCHSVCVCVRARACVCARSRVNWHVLTNGHVIGKR
jgi:hypothetical protein